MTKFIVITKKQLMLLLAVVIFVIGAWMYEESNSFEEMIQPVSGSHVNAREIHLIAGEFCGLTKDGQKIEAYRWDPSTIIVDKGEQVKLVIRGINGQAHPFIIEGTDIKGEVRQGEETVVNFTAEAKGIYRLICLAHPDTSSNGPMIAYIVVE